MRTGISFTVSTADRARLEAIVADRNSPQKHVWRCRIVLLTAAGLGTNAIMREAGVAKTAVWRWQERFAAEGVDGLLRDKTRPSRIPPLDPSVAERVVALTLTDPPGETTHWTAATMAAQTGISVSSVQRIWRAHGLAPHRIRQFKLSNDPEFVTKLRDVVGLYVDPPAHAIVLSVDEKSQIQALDRIPAGPSTSCRPHVPGSTPSKASSPGSPSAASSAASSALSPTSRPPSTASSTSTTPQIRSPSTGQPIPTKSSPPSGVGTKCWILSTSGSNPSRHYQDARPSAHG